MATKDYILGLGTEPKGSQERSEQKSGENAPATAPSVAPPATTEAKPQVVLNATETTSEGPAMSYMDMYKKLNPYTSPTDEELAKEKKKQKREQIFAAIGDGVSALANLYFTTQGAPNMYTGKNTASERTQIRYDKLKKERETNNTAYYNGMIRAMQADDEKGRDVRNWKQKLADFGLRERAQTRLEADAETRKNIGEARVGVYEAQQAKDDAMTAFYEAKAKALEEGIPLEKALKIAKTAKERALANKANRSGGNDGGEFRAYERNGNVRYFKTHKAQESFARQEGTWSEGSSISTTVKDTPIGEEKSTTTKKTGGTSVKPKAQPQPKSYKNTKALGL